MVMTNPDPLPEGRYKAVWLNRREGYAPTTCPPSCSPSLATPGRCPTVPTCTTSFTAPAAPPSTLPPAADAASRTTSRKHDSARFPMPLGSAMPDVRGCDRVDYRVLFIDSIWG